MNDSVSIETALGYRAAGLGVLPAIKAEKRPSVGAWSKWTSQLPSEYDVKAWFGNRPDGVCLVAGAVSGNLECIDFDNHGELFEKWKASVDPALYNRLVVERTQSGGYHVVYRSEAPVDGNMKLARGDRGGTLLTLIETRGEGGLFLCAPTNGYTLVQGDFAQVPTLAANEREVLLAAARALDEARGGTAEPAHKESVSLPSDFDVRPGDDFNARGDIRPILLTAGWTRLNQMQGQNELWRRPGKTEGGHSATFNGEVFNVFSTNAAPFEPGRGYCKFQVYAFLVCGGDFTRAANELLKQGYGTPQAIKSVDFSQLSATFTTPPVMKRTGGLVWLGDLVRRCPNMRPTLIHGLLRLGETMNIIAPPKTGKSWLVTDLAIAVATGRPWFGFPCEQGKVLIIDNELHEETSASRIPKVVAARGVPFADVEYSIVLNNQRGHIRSVTDIAERIEEFRGYDFKLIIIDAFYRALPEGTDENSNAAMMSIYNLIDAYATELNCAFVLIHHTSKGDQSAKSVTDVGAGAGAQSRAADTHVILRHHKEPNAVVMETVVRSFPSVSPVCLRWEWPVWIRDDSLDPTELEVAKRGKPKAAVKMEELVKPEIVKPQKADPSEIARRLVELVGDPPLNRDNFIALVRRTYDIPRNDAQFAVDEAISRGFVRYDRVETPSGAFSLMKFILPPAVSE